MQNTLKRQRIYKENSILLIIELNMLGEQNEQANKSYIINPLTPKIKNKSNKISFVMLFDEIQDTITFHQRFPNTRLMGQIHDRLLYRHTNDTHHYLSFQIYSFFLNSKRKNNSLFFLIL